MLPAIPHSLRSLEISSEEEDTEDHEKPSDAAEPNDGNFFAALNHPGDSDSGELKRVFELSPSSLRIELSKGQSIVLLGLCGIWVRSGEIDAYGAILRAGPTLHRIYAPTTHALPQVVALSSSADFVLESVDDGLRDLQKGHIWSIWDAPGIDTDVYRSFHVVSWSH